MFFLRVCIAKKLRYKEKTLHGNHYHNPFRFGRFCNTNTKVEWTNSLIKTVRRRTYGYKDNDYFFLKIMDESRREYVRNPKSHNYYD